jgi:RND family efflux transporter MFP subunit
VQRSFLLLPVCAILLSACGGEPEQAATGPQSRPVKTLVIAGTGGGGIRQFPARIDAAQKAELAFRVAGTVTELLVKEGDEVQAGQTVAKLDPKDLEIVVNDRQATFDNASKNYERARQLVEKGHISKMDFDRLEAEFKTTRAALDAARQELSYAVLTAPFTGVVARRQVEQFEEVQAKQPVLTLQDLAALEVKLDVPEALLRGLRSAGESREERRSNIKVFASFEGLAGQRFPLQFKEIATKADAQTQTFEATYTMAQTDGATILPGMTATVTVDLSRYSGDGAASYQVPATAVVGDYRLDPQVWVVDEQTMTVHPRPVRVGTLSGGLIRVTEGLEPGLRILVAGAAFAAEGMPVTLLPEREQAAPRSGDEG